MSLGENIKKRRREMNLSQETFGDMINVHENTIRKWEKGTSYPNAAELKNIAEALDTTTDALFDDKTPSTFVKNSAYQDKTEIKNSVPSMAYWGSLVDNAEKTAENGKNITVIINLVKTALNILESSIEKTQNREHEGFAESGGTLYASTLNF